MGGTWSFRKFLDSMDRRRLKQNKYYLLLFIFLNQKSHVIFRCSVFDCVQWVRVNVFYDIAFVDRFSSIFIIYYFAGCLWAHGSNTSMSINKHCGCTATAHWIYTHIHFIKLVEYFAFLAAKRTCLILHKLCHSG